MARVKLRAHHQIYHGSLTCNNRSDDLFVARHCVRSFKTKKQSITLDPIILSKDFMERHPNIHIPFNFRSGCKMRSAPRKKYNEHENWNVFENIKKQMFTLAIYLIFHSAEDITSPNRKRCHIIWWPPHYGTDVAICFESFLVEFVGKKNVLHLRSIFCLFTDS